jgi:hypothetical protein
LRIENSGEKPSSILHSPFSLGEIVLCTIAALTLAALEIVFFTPIVWGGNER